MQKPDVLGRQMTRRLLLGATGMGGLALLPAPARAEETVDLRVPGGPSTRAITTAYPQKGRMILQRTSPPWLETPFEVFDKGVFTPNDQHYVSWHFGAGRVRSSMSNWSDEETDDPLIADHHNFYKVEKWTRDGMKVDSLLYAGNNLSKAQEILADAIKHWPRIRITIRQRTRVLQRWPQQKWRG